MSLWVNALTDTYAKAMWQHYHALDVRSNVCNEWHNKNPKYHQWLAMLCYHECSLSSMPATNEVELLWIGNERTRKEPFKERFVPT